MAQDHRSAGERRECPVARVGLRVRPPCGHIALSVVAALIFAGAIVPAARAEQPPGSKPTPRAVIELFTSQGCSSCAPADKVLSDIAGDSSIVAMSLHIDYWDYLGWKDTLAIPRHTARQRGYATARGDREMYTPQAIVNGITQVLGSDRGAIDDEVARSERRHEAFPIAVKVTHDAGGVTIAIPAVSGSANSGEVWLCAISSKVTVKIARGENSGRTMAYSNVVRRWVKVGEWSGAEQTWTIPKEEFAGDNIDRVAVLVQSGRSDTPGPIMGATMLDLR